MLTQHFGESYGKATRQVLRERPQDLLKERLSDIRYRRQSSRLPNSGDHNVNSSRENNGHKETDRCRCVHYSEGRCVGRHSKDGGRNNASTQPTNRCTNKHSASKARGNRDGSGQNDMRQSQPACIFIEAYGDRAPDCCSQTQDRCCKSTPPPPQQPQRENENVPLHCHYPLFIAAPFQPIVADPYCQQQRDRSGQSYPQKQGGTSRGKTCCQQESYGSRPSHCQQKSGSSGTSQCQKQQMMSGQSCCGRKGQDKKTWTCEKQNKVPLFRQCGVIPKYTGHITGMKFTIGESYGPSADRLLGKHHDKMKARNIYYR